MGKPEGEGDRVRGRAGSRRSPRAFAAMVALLAVAAVVLAGCAGSYTSPATNVGSTSATVKGLVFSTVDATVTYWFEYGPTTDYGDESTHRSIAITDRDNHAVSEALSGLDSGTTYHYRVCARDGGTLCGSDRTFTTTGGATELAIDADPALSPGFDPQVSDYVTRCGPDPVDVEVAAPGDTTVSVDGSTPRNGTFSVDVPLDAGERFTIEATGRVARSTYHVRCLPGDFPAWSWTSPGDPSARFYITMPRNVQTPAGNPAGRYIAIFDDEGVPVWWMESSGSSDAKLLADGTLAWGRTPTAGGGAAGYEIHRLDGSLVRTWRTVGTDTDVHDFELLANGNALLMSYRPRPGTQDLTEYGGPATGGTPIDAEIQEVKPDGTVAWSWNSKDHIDLSETPERWLSRVYGLPGQLPDGRQGFDWIHINSLQKVGNTLVMSFRHLDAFYGIDMTTGEIIWKLGGTPTANSLDVVADPESNPLGGPHHARVLPNGNMTGYDNNTNETAAPRGVEYQMNLFDGTATLVETVNDPDVPSSPCCGSATKLGDGSWLVSWGGTEVISEFGPGGNRHFKLQFTSNTGSFGFSYRADPVGGGGPTIGEFRAGMDAMP
jgi:hypothetical protein